jgi:hypothetical protein
MKLPDPTCSSAVVSCCIVLKEACVPVVEHPYADVQPFIKTQWAQPDKGF